MRQLLCQLGKVLAKPHLHAPPLSSPRDSITTFPWRGLTGTGEALTRLHERQSGLHSIVPATLTIRRGWVTVGISWDGLLFLMWSPLQKITSSPSLTQLRPSPAAKEKHQRQYLLSPSSLFFSLPCRQTQHEVPEELAWEDASPAGSQMPTASPAHV